MKTLPHLVVALALSSTPHPAVADEPAAPEAAKRLRLRVETQVGAKELAPLLRANTVRAGLQRHRLWAESVAREEDRAAETDKPARRKRDSARKVAQKHTRPAAPAPAPAAEPTQPARPAPASTEHTVAPSEAPATPGTSERAQPDRTMNRKSLRNMLRDERKRGHDRLERELRDRIEQQERRRRQRSTSGRKRRGGDSGGGGAQKGTHRGQ